VWLDPFLSTYTQAPNAHEVGEDARIDGDGLAELSYPAKLSSRLLQGHILVVLTFVRPLSQMSRDPIDICMQRESRKLFSVEAAACPDTKTTSPLQECNILKIQE
jgi:hypothetical protein